MFFVKGLNPEYKLHVMNKSPKSLQEAISAATLAESARTLAPPSKDKELHAKIDALSSQLCSTPPTQPMVRNIDSRPPRSNVFCQFCGIPGHVALDCRKRLHFQNNNYRGNRPPQRGNRQFNGRQNQPRNNNSRNNTGSSITCYQCGKRGHIARNCFQRQNLNCQSPQGRGGQQ